ncbi:MAG: aryl-sulfate sulfotransferase [Bryobacteraceae bacterium]
MPKPLLAVLAFTGLCCGATDVPLTVRLLPSLPSPQAVGSPIGLTPRIENAAEGMHVYRYSVSVDGGPFRITRDFSQQADFVWNPALYEHEAKLRVTVRNNKTKATAETEIPFRVIPRAKGPEAVVTATANPLVALLSAPACPEGSQFRGAFRRQGEEAISHTNAQPCRGSRTNNVYIAGMRSDTGFQLRSEVLQGTTVKPGAWIPFHTGLLDGDFPAVSIPVPRAQGSTAVDPVLIHSVASAAAGRRPMATDMDGNVIWYMRTPEFLTRVLPGGRFLVLSEGSNAANDMKRLQVLRELDLAGQVIRETNISRVAEQLDAYGIHSDCKKDGKECVSGFHHEAIRVPGDHTLVIAGLERMFPAGTQGSKEAVDILGDLVIDLDEQFQVAGLWNSFDHFDIKRASLGDEKCAGGPGRGGCAPIFLAAQANGWLHSNSLNYIPATGDFLISMPEQNWVLKIDWRNGKGTGKILWRLGEGGDFTAKSDDPDPWFSFQHDAGFEPVGSNLLSILDDGHTRFKKNPKAHNRGQVWKLDEQARTATLVHNADLGVYAIAVGSAQTLSNGGHTFEAGFINPVSPYARAVETSADGKVVYAQQVDGIIVYRSFRVPDMYSAPLK